ncbi:hypothetical protein [Prosthecobacter algae]
MLPAHDWPVGLHLALTEKVMMPKVQPHCTNPDYAIQDADLTRETITLFPPERLILQRLVNQGRHAVCLHGGVNIVVLSTRYLKPLEKDQAFKTAQAA